MRGRARRTWRGGRIHPPGRTFLGADGVDTAGPGLRPREPAPRQPARAAVAGAAGPQTPMRKLRKRCTPGTVFSLSFPPEISLRGTSLLEVHHHHGVVGQTQIGHRNGRTGSTGAEPRKPPRLSMSPGLSSMPSFERLGQPERGTDRLSHQHACRGARPISRPLTILGHHHVHLFQRIEERAGSARPECAARARRPEGGVGGDQFERPSGEPSSMRSGSSMNGIRARDVVQRLQRRLGVGQLRIPDHDDEIGLVAQLGAELAGRPASS